LPKGIGALPAVFKLVIKYEKGAPRIVCRIKTVTKDIPLGVLMRALGLQNDMQMFQCICEKSIMGLAPFEFEELKGMIEIIRFSIEQVTMVKQEECLALIGKYIEKLKVQDATDTMVDFAKHILMDKVVPHVGTDE
jgi:DNA-directed RNA polymerase beta subunit